MPPLDPQKLRKAKAVERADIERRAKVERAESRALLRLERKNARAAWWAAWRERWPKWVAFWERVARYLKTAATVTTSLAAIGAFAWRVWLFYDSRRKEPDLPPATGAATTAVDFPKTAGRPGSDSPRPRTPNPKD